MKRVPAIIPCPCGLPAAYAACCGRWHHGVLHLQAPNAQTLMRSRYSAYVLDELDYVLQTWHPDTRPDTLEPNEPGTRWLGLDVRRYSQTDADHAMVEFVARVRVQGRATRLHEISQFVRVDGRWLYLNASA
ncbi:YchJ family metal-binding protein [Castellaniella caeni]